MSQFAFVQREWADVYDAAVRAEVAVHRDARIACFYAPRALALAVAWAYKHDAALHVPYDDRLSALIHEPTFTYSNGYEHWIWDDVNYPPRAVHGFYKKPELEADSAARA